MPKRCRTENAWHLWKSKGIYGRGKQINIAPSDGYGELPLPHILGPRCFCHPANTVNEEGIPVFVHEHPLTEAR
jgi:hypothetical protein